MNHTDDRYRQFCLTREMLETPRIIAGFDTSSSKTVAGEIAAAGRLLLTGEGSSRLFPAKSSIAHARRCGWPLVLHTDAGRQSFDYDLSGWAVFAASNSGKTAEVIRLYQKLREQRHGLRFSLSATPNSKLQELANSGFVLSCGKEEAVAATKSVIEQALFYRSLLEHISGQATLAGRLPELGRHVETALTTSIDPSLVQRIARAGTIYWAGRNDGVAEELTLKTNEITRKKSDFLEGTYAVHGIEEVMNADDVLLWVDPYEESEAKFQECLGRGVGMQIIAISSRPTAFPTILIPDAGDLSNFVQLAAGWNVLIEVGLSLGINLDKPERARKVGNEFTP
jgi:glucosamine--fructose-6-phosphate aminotransferase (isomerizing)